MKNIITIISLSVLTLCSVNSQGQVRNDVTEVLNQALDQTLHPFEDNNVNIEGSPYLYEEFKPATLMFPNDETLQAKVRYHVLNEEMQVLFPPESYRVLHNGIFVKIGNDLFKKFSYRGEDKRVQLLGYFQVLTNGQDNKPLILLKKHSKSIERGKPAKAMQAATPPEYDDEENLFLKFSNSNEAVMVEKDKDDFLELFPENYRDQMEDFMDEENLKPKREKDLHEIVDYYNSRIKA